MIRFFPVANATPRAQRIRFKKTVCIAILLFVAALTGSASWRCRHGRWRIARGIGLFATQHGEISWLQSAQ